MGQEKGVMNRRTKRIRGRRKKSERPGRCNFNLKNQRELSPEPIKKRGGGVNRKDEIENEIEIREKMG